MPWTRAGRQAYDERNQERLKLQKRAWREANSEKVAKQVRQWRTENKDQLNAGQTRYRHKNPSKYMLYEARKRAKKKGLAFELTVEDILIPENCPVLNIPLVVGGKTHSPGSPTLDRVDSTKGYIRGNVRVISFRANNLKNNATIEELEAIVSYMRKHFQSTLKPIEEPIQKLSSGS